MFGPLGNKVAKTAGRMLERHIVAPCAVASGPGGYADPLLEAAGVECERVLRHRGDERSVFLVRHPVRGRCILKTSYAFGSAEAGLRNVRLAEFVAASGAPIFPEVYEATGDYTLEEFIPGKPLREWLDQDFALAPLKAFFGEFQRWSGQPGLWLATPLLFPHEIKTIIRSYIGKCIHQNAYFDTRRRLSGIFNLFRRRRELLQDLAWLGREAERIKIPRGLMCGDLSNVNLIVDEARSRVFIIDYEMMSPGNIGFDCAYLIASLEKLPVRMDAMQEIRGFLHSEAFAGSPERARFFSVYTNLLTGISQTIYRQRGWPDSDLQDARTWSGTVLARSP